MIANWVVLKIFSILDNLDLFRHFRYFRLFRHHHWRRRLILDKLPFLFFPLPPLFPISPYIRERRALLLNELSGDKYNYVQEIFASSVVNATEKERLKTMNLAENESLNHSAISFCWPNLGSSELNFREENRNFLIEETTGELYKKPFSYLSHAKL